MTPTDETINFLRLRISRVYETQLNDLGRLLGHKSPAQTVEWLLDRHLAENIHIQREVLGENQ